MKYWLLVFAACCGLSTVRAAEAAALAHFRKEIRPVLEQYCFDCHGDGENKGGIAFDELKSDEAILNHELWLKVMKNLRAGLMPPPKKPRPAAEEQKHLAEWIKYNTYAIDPKNPDPGRVTVRRLNRVEYRNTIRDLLGVEFDTENEFPPDDTGYGFDNIGTVLTVSPMLLEKYLAAAKTIVTEAVPTVSKTMPERTIAGNQFRGIVAGASREEGGRKGGRLSLSYYEPAAVSNIFRIEHAGRYQLVLAMSANEKHVEGQSDLNRCRLVFKADGQELLRKEYV